MFLCFPITENKLYNLVQSLVSKGVWNVCQQCVLMFPYYSQIDCIPNLSQKWLIACITHTPSTLLYPQKGQKEGRKMKRSKCWYLIMVLRRAVIKNSLFWILLKIVVQPGKAKYIQVQLGTIRYSQVQKCTTRYS